MSAPYRLRSCVWEITLACCFSCKYCGSKGGRARENELTTAECLGVAEQLAALGCRRVSLIGGEVFLRPDWETIVRALTSRGVKTAVITNGFRFAPELVDRLRGAQVESVAVSIDAPRELHDAYRQQGSFDRALAAVDALAMETPYALGYVAMEAALSGAKAPCMLPYRLVEREEMYAAQNVKLMFPLLH